MVTIYTMLGGIQAVIWNDVMQFCIMFGGLAATVGDCVVERAGRLRRDLASARGGGQARTVWPPLVDPAATGVVGADRELLSAADER